MTSVPRIFISASRDEHLSQRQRAVKLAIFEELEANGFEPWGYFKQGPLRKGWGFAEANAAMAESHGALVLGFAQWESKGIGPRDNEIGLKISEGNHLEGGLAIAHGVPLLVIKEEGSQSRGILDRSPSHAVVNIPSDLSDDWIHSDDSFGTQFSWWCDEVRQRWGSRKKVFLIHGHDPSILNEVRRFVEQNGLEPQVLRDLPDHGRAVIQKFLDYSSVDFAIAILTPDDLGGARNKLDSQNKFLPRARQNVILELGFFLGRLGPGRVFILFKKDLEIPSDYSGVQFIEIDDNGLWKNRLAREMKAAGIIVEMTSLLS